MVIEPDVGVSRRLRQRRNVDLPQPLAPMIAAVFPSGSARLTPFTATVSPYRLVTPLTSMKLAVIRRPVRDQAGVRSDERPTPWAISTRRTGARRSSALPAVDRSTLSVPTP